jgi:hypothetical protein
MLELKADVSGDSLLSEVLVRAGKAKGQYLNEFTSSYSFRIAPFDEKAAIELAFLTLTRAVAAGGNADPNPAQDHGFMFSRSIEDPDGYVWEFMWMDAAAHAETLESA